MFQVELLRIAGMALVGLTLNSIISRPAGGTELTDLETYKIAWMGPLTSSENLDEDNVIDIQTKTKERYTCVVPGNDGQINFDTSAKNSSSSPDGEVKDAFDYLEPLMKGNYCSYKFEIYWIYELCHGKFLRQYHQEKVNSRINVIHEFFLGIMDPALIRAQVEESRTNDHPEIPDQNGEKINNHNKDVDANGRPTVLVDGQRKPYVMLKMTGGTKCDLTKKSRSAKILYVCNDKITNETYSIKETSTCEYEAIVQTPLLCQHKDFKLDTNTQHEIRCYSMDGSPRRPANSLDDHDLESPDDDVPENPLERTIAVVQGRTLIIDADLLLR